MTLITTTIVMAASLILGLRYWGVLLAVAANGYQFSQSLGGSVAISTVIGALPIAYLLTRLPLSRRYQFSGTDLLLVIWFGAIAVNILRSYSFEGPLILWTRILFFCGCYFVLGRLLAATPDSGYRYLQEFIIAIVVLTLFFGIFAQDVSTHEESIIEQEELGREVELKGRVAVGEGNPVGYSASLNTGASALVALLCIGIFSRGVLQFRFVMFVAVSLAAILPVAIATGTRGLLVSIVGVGGIMAILVRMRHRPVLHQIIGAIVFLFAFALIGRFVLPWFLSGISTWIEHVFGPGQGYYLQNLASLLEGTELGDQSTDSRRWLWSLAWDFIVQYPILGMPTDRYYEAASQGFYAHNYFLEQWNIAGFAGFACAIGLVFAVARAAYVLVNASDLRVYVVGMVHTAIFFGFLIQSQFSFTLFQGRMMFLAAGIVIGLELAERKKLSAVRGAPKPTLVRQGDTP